MKIRLTENQYKKLFKEGDESLSIGNTITPKILKIMRSLNKIYNGTDSTINELITNWGLNNSDATTIVHNYEQIFKNLPDEEYESFLGKPLEFQGTYVINCTLPAIVEARTFFDYQITVRAGSREEALVNASELINNHSFDGAELIDSPQNASVELDWDFPDATLVRDMAADILDDFSGFPPTQLERFIDLKK